MKTTRKIISVAVAGACAWMAAPAWSQQASAPPATQVVTVSGFRAAAEDALNIKRDADGFVDAISADGLGRFPDLNVGEALSRIPGVQIDRDAADRNATVSLRGLPGTFAMVTLNGLGLASPAVAGANPLGTFSSAVFSRFVVNKSPGASDAAGGLSGNIDLQMSGALVRKDGGEITVSEEYNTLGKGKAPSATLKYTKHLTPDLAVYGTLVYKKERFRRDSITQNYTQAYNSTSYIDSGNSANRIVNIGALTDYFAAPGTTFTSPAGITQQVLDIKPGTNTTTGVLIPVGTAGSSAGIGITTPIVGTGAKSNTGLFFANATSQNSRDAVGDNRSAAFGLEYKVNSGLKLGVTYMGAQRSLDQGTVYSLSNANNLGGARITVDPASIFLSPDGNAYVGKYDYENVQVNSTASYQATKSRVDALTTTANWNSGLWRANTSASYSRGTGNFDQVQTRLLFNQVGSSSTIPMPSNGVYGTVNTGSGDIGKYVWTLAPANPFTIPKAPLRIDNMNTLTPNAVSVYSGSWQIRGATPPGIGAGWVQLVGQNQQTDNSVAGLQQNFERDVSELPYLGRLFRSIVGGGRYERNTFKSSFYRITAYGANPDGISDSFVAGSYPNADGFFGGAAPGFNASWQAANLAAMTAGLKPTAASLVPGQQLTPIGFPVEIGPTGFVSDPNNTDQFTKNFTNDYSVASAFMQANIDTSVFGLKLRGNVGLRREQSKKSIALIDRGLTVVNGQSYVNKQPREFDNTYAYNLPSFLLAADVTKDVVVRFGAYKTYVRPNRADENPTTSLSVNQSLDVTRYGISLGKNDLKPYTGVSMDFGIEWYNRKGSVIGFNVYQKDISGYIYSFDKVNRPDLACPESGIFNGVDYGTGPLTYSANPVRAGEECVAVNPDTTNMNGDVPARVVVNTTGSVNSETKVKLSGVEITTQQNLSFLPGFLKNFGAGANMSVSRLEGTLPNGSKIRLTNAAKTNANLIVFYEQGPFGTRLIYNKRGEYYVNGGSVQFDRKVKARGQLDGVVSWKFGGAQLAFDMYNLTNAKVQQFQEDERALRNVDYDGRTFALSLRSSF